MVWFLLIIVGLMLLVTIILLLQVAIAKYIERRDNQDKP